MLNRPQTTWCYFCGDEPKTTWPTHIDFCKHFIKKHLHDFHDESKYRLSCHYCIFEYLQNDDNPYGQKCTENCTCENNFDFVFVQHQCTGTILKLTQMYTHIDWKDCDVCVERIAKENML